MKNTVLKVRLWGKEVGSLRWDERKVVAYFAYSEEFLTSGLNPFPFVAPLGVAKSYLPIVGDKRKIFAGLPPFVADSLPDNWGSLVFEQWAQNQGLRSRDITPLDKLAYIGKRGIGALEYFPESDSGLEADNLAVDELARLACKIYEQRSEAHILPDESLTLQRLFEVGTSAGGRQPKAIVAINETTKEIRSGQIDGLKGFDYYILKFAVGDGYPATQMEMTYYEMACKAGLRMMPSRFLEVEGEKHFLTKRFDRFDGNKVFTQTLAAVNPDAVSYEDLFDVCRRLKLSETEIREVFRFMVFNVFASNTDDHVKNISFIMSENGEWHIAPFYDLTFTADLNMPGVRYLHCLSLKGKLDGFTVQDVKSFGVGNGVKNPSEIIVQVCEAVSCFRELALKNGVPFIWVDRIEQYLSSIVPEEYKEKMSSWKPNQFSETIKGHSVSNVRFEMSANGNIHLMAVIDGFERKYVIAPKRAEFMEIMEKGFNTMPDAQKMEFVERLMFSLS